MVECSKCRYTDPAHDPACPKSMSGVQKKQAEKAYEEGYQNGRSGDEKLAGSDPSYSLGYKVGVVALESAQNGHDPRFAQLPDLEEATLALRDFDDMDGDPLEDYQTHYRDTD